MRTIRASLCVGTVALAASLPGFAQIPGVAAKVANPKDLQLVDLGRVKSWKPGGARLLYLKDGQDQWYRVEIQEPCMDLFPGKDPTFVTLTDTAGTRYSGVVIEHHQCDVTRIAKMTEAPPTEAYVPPPQKLEPPAAPKPAAKGPAPAPK